VKTPAVRARTRAGLDALVGVLAPWITARVIVLAALALARFATSRTHAQAATVTSVRHGLLGWDAGWYAAIARSGYAALGDPALRFFPLFPLAARALGSFGGLGDGPAVVLLANLSALIGTALVLILVRRETGDAVLARRTTWLLCLAPAAFTFVFGYAEGFLLVAAVACFLAIRPVPGDAPAWWWASLFGVAAGLTRPLGVLLVLPIGVEALRRWRAGRPPQRAASVVAVLGPLIGTVAFLTWSATSAGGFFEPLRVQTQRGHHGALGDPIVVVYDALRGAHHHLGTALHIPWVILGIVLVVVVWQRLPASYGIFSTAVLVAALSGSNLDSFERYGLSAFPLVIGAAFLTRGPRMERAVLALLGAGLGGYALLAFLGLYVP
jgi:hypothetical protein